MKQILALFTMTFWRQTISELRSFLYGNVRAIRSLGYYGENTNISPSARFGYPENIYIGSDCSISHHNHLYAGPNSKLTIGDNTMLGPHVFMTTDSFSKSKYEIGEVHSGHEGDIVIGKNVRVGAHAIILPGVSIGEGASIGAGSVVTKDIQAGAIAAGNPAEVIKKIQ